jgi:hypothetical protein
VRLPSADSSFEVPLTIEEIITMAVVPSLDPADLDALLARSPTPGAEEWAIHDCDDFAGLQLDASTDLATVSRLANGLAAYGPAFAALVTWLGPAAASADRFEALERAQAEVALAALDPSPVLRRRRRDPFPSTAPGAARVRHRPRPMERDAARRPTVDTPIASTTGVDRSSRRRALMTIRPTSSATSVGRYTVW